MSSASPSVSIRRARPEDSQECGRICYRAFHKINTDHGFPSDFPSAEPSIGVLTMMFSHPGWYCVVAEAGGRIIGSNCLDERTAIAGVGPITVDPDAQNRGAGGQLMQAVLDRARERGFAGVRLVQAAFHNRSLSLYTKLGFDVREPLSVVNGPPLRETIEGCSVRPARRADVPICNQLCLRIHGHHRGGELEDNIGKTAVVVERHGKITGYATALGVFGHAVAETLPDLQAMIASATEFLGPGFLMPTRNAELFRWCLSHGLRVVEPMTLMSLGLYNEPSGAYLPSILF